MIVRLHYADGKTEDHALKDGIHFVDYYKQDEVPGSKMAFKLRNQQIRYLAIKPKRNEVVDQIELVKGEDDTAPIVMAVTVELRKEDTLASTSAPGTAWRVTPDPTKQSLEIPAGQDLSVQIPLSSDGSVRVLYPTTPSPYVAVGDNLSDQEARELWDMRTKRRVGVIRGNLKVHPPYALSPDGNYFAARTTKEKKDDDKDKNKDQPKGATIGVWSFKTGQEVKLFKIEFPTADYLDFAGEGQLVVGAFDLQMFHVWNIEEGEKSGEFETPGPVDPESLALSPGRKHLAMSSVRDGRIWVYDLANATLVGEAVLPKDGSPGWGCPGMSFSNDGKELAAVFDSGGKPRILCWDVATGKQAYDRPLDARYGLRRYQEDQGRAVEWLPDRGGWLVYGQAIIDRQSTQRIWSLPLYYPDFPPAPRRLLDGDRALIVWGATRNQLPQVRTVTFPKDKFVSARQLVRSGGSAVDAVLPPVKPGDISTKHPVPAPASAWSVKPDPAQKPAKSLVSRQIALRGKIYEAQYAICSGAEAPQAVVAFRGSDRNEVAGNVLAAGQSFWLERYDLTNGKRLSSNDSGDFPSVYELVGFSSDASTIMLRDADKRERLDIYSAGDLKYLCGWRPYDKETGNDRTVVWASFLDQHKVLTSNTSGKLMLWNVPDCRVVYAIPEAYQGTPILSPGRKCLAGFSGSSAGSVIRFFDTASGQRLGEIPTPSADDGGKPGLLAGAFRFDGQQFAALLNGNQLVRFDLTKGKVLAEFHSPVQPGPLLEWCGDRHVLVNNFSLVDLDRQWEVWRYLSGVPCQGSPDGKHWAVVEPYANSPSYLGAFQIPEKGLDRIVAIVADKKAPALLRAGSSIDLRVEAKGPTIVESKPNSGDSKAKPKEDDTFRKSVFEQFASQLKANGITVDDSQPVSLVVRVDEVDTGEKAEAWMLTPGLKKDSEEGKKSIAFKNLEYDIAFVDGGARATLEPRQTISLRDYGPLQIPPGTKEPANYLSEQLWKIARSRLANVVIPPFVARQPEGLVRFPGFSNLGSASK
jgi:WD40 repeat protein